MLRALLLATDLGGLAAGAWLLWGRARGRPIWSSDARRLGALGALLGAGTLAVGSALGGGFLVLRLWCHVLFCVLAPLAIARGAQRRGLVGAAVVVLGLSAEGAYLWARRVEPYRLEITRHELTSVRLDGGTGPVRVAVLADLQTDEIGAFEPRVFAELERLRPDLVLIPGDLLQLDPGAGSDGAQRERAKLRALFSGLLHAPRLGFLMVAGDCEPADARYDDCGVRLLHDETVVFAEERLQVIGLSCRASRRALERRVLEAADAFAGLTIVLGHAPDFALSAERARVPLLCLAGHTHGGQVQLPLVGPLLTLSRVPRAIAAGGLHRLERSWVCVSRGIGMERRFAPRIRFLCRPELVLFELRPSTGASDASQ